MEKAEADNSKVGMDDNSSEEETNTDNKDAANPTVGGKKKRKRKKNRPPSYIRKNPELLQQYQLKKEHDKADPVAGDAIQPSWAFMDLTDDIEPDVPTAAAKPAVVTKPQTASNVTKTQALNRVTKAQTASNVTMTPTASNVTMTSTQSTKAQTASKVTKTQTLKNDTKAQTASNVTKTQALNKVTKAQTASNVTMTPTASNVTMTPTASNVTMTPTASNVTKTQALNKVTKAQTASNVTITPTASNVTMTPTASNVKKTQSSNATQSQTKPQNASNVVTTQTASTLIMPQTASNNPNSKYVCYMEKQEIAPNACKPHSVYYLTKSKPPVPYDTKHKPTFGKNQTMPTNSKGTPGSYNITLTGKSRLAQWNQFKESLQKKLEVKSEVNELIQENFTLSNTQHQQQIIQQQTQTQLENKEVKWELNNVKNEDASTQDNADVEKTQKQPVDDNSAGIKVVCIEKLKAIPTIENSAAIRNLARQESKSNKPTLNQKQLRMAAARDSNSAQYNFPVQPTEMKTPQPLMDIPMDPSVPRNYYTKQYQGMMGPRLTGVPRSFLTKEHQEMIGGVHLSGVPRSFLTKEHQEMIGGVHLSDSNTFIPGMNPLGQPAHEAQGHYKAPVFVQTFSTGMEKSQQYSPSDTYVDRTPVDQVADVLDGAESPESLGGQKRLSAFERLGPLSKPKKPKLTINLLCSKDQSVREVVNEPEKEEYTPVHLRLDMEKSSDETVMKYLPLWPWKKNVALRKTVTARPSKSVMILEQEQMEENYLRDQNFIHISVKGYPATWKKEDVLDAILDAVRGKSFIPCFVEFTSQECKFLVIRSRSALTTIHKLGFCIRKDDVHLAVTISTVDLTLNQLDFIPRLVLRKRLVQEYDGERKLSLKKFTMGPDISHFIYFPLNRLTNQTELLQLQSTVGWNYLTDLNLSHNRLTSLDGFELPNETPKLKNLDISYNCIDKVTVLLRCRTLCLKTLNLEGNPLCHDYIDPGHYIKVVRMIFPGLIEIDGVPIVLKGDLPPIKRNYCPSEAMDEVEKLLEIFFPLLDEAPEDRARMEDLYDQDAVLTITYNYKLRYRPVYRYFRNLFLRCRVFDEGEDDSVEGAAAIIKLINKWPALQHDPYTFTVDLLHHNDTSVIVRIGGILKLTAESLADDEHLLAFTRTLVLTTEDGVEYKILNEMLYWDEPNTAYANTAFHITTVNSKRLSLKLESTPDEDLKENLIEIFSRITDLDRESTERCLELKDWNLKIALEYFVKLVKLDNLDSMKFRTD